MPDKRKWREDSSRNTSFDDPNYLTEKSKGISQNGILSILGKNIGLLSRKHSRERHKKYEKSSHSQSKSPNKIKISNILKFSKSTENKQIVCRAKSQKEKSQISNKKTRKVKSIDSKPNIECKDKHRISNYNNNVVKEKESNKCTDGSCQEQESSKTVLKSKNFKQNKCQVTKNSKPVIEKKVSQSKSKLIKSNSDTALNVTRGRSRGSSTHSTSSRAASTSSRALSSNSRCSSRTTLISGTSSKSMTPQFPKKSIKNLKKKKNNVESLSSPDSGSSSGNPAPASAVFVNYRYQNRRLVTSRQRQEIYALNQLMTDLERENFNRVCQEKGYVMDA